LESADSSLSVATRELAACEGMASKTCRYFSRQASITASCSGVGSRRRPNHCSFSIRIDPAFEPLRSNPRFQRLAAGTQ